MVSHLINFLFRRHTVSYKLHYIERLIAEKKYVDASVYAYLALQKFPDHPELLALKTQAEKEIAHYIYNQEF